MTYNQALDFIFKQENSGIVPGLENIQNLMFELDNIHEKLKIIHIAGTNGKGSVGSFIASILKNSNFKTGRYVSPSVYEYLEKFQINDNIITKQKFCDLCEKVKSAVDRLIKKNKSYPTVFEIETAIAFLYFYQEKCDFVLLETGMGGRLDATNVISQNVCSVITSISIDHTKFLGKTLSEIAGEKCGIIKKNCPVIFIEQDNDINNIIKNTCIKQNSYFKIVIKNDIKFKYFDGESQVFSYKNYDNIKIKLLGKFQIENASIAIAIAEFLRSIGYHISDENIYNGLLLAYWQARFQILRKNPLFIIDGAHNPNAVERLVETLKIYFPNKKLIFIVGIFKDKDFKKIAEISAGLADKIYTFGLDSPRGLESSILTEEFLKYNKNTIKAENILDAIYKSFLNASQNDVIVSFGSLSYLGEVIDIIKNYK